MLERRREQRRSIFLDGKIGFSGRQFRLACLVQNVSLSGAKLVLRSAADIPVEFSLTVSSQQQITHRVRARWRRRNTIGVEIEHRHETNSLDGPQATLQKTGSANVRLAA
jgi:hypothetical protein